MRLFASSRRRSTTLLSVAAISLLLAPTAALAAADGSSDDGEDTPVTAATTDDEGDAEGDETEGGADEGDPEGEDATGGEDGTDGEDGHEDDDTKNGDEDAPADDAPADEDVTEEPAKDDDREPATDDKPADTPATVVPATCDDHLVTFSLGRVDGDDRAVSITAQSLELGVDGWTMLTWKAASSTELRAVLATGTDGIVRELAPTADGTTYDVAALTFCGTAAETTSAAPATTDAAGTDDRTGETTDPDAGDEAPSADEAATTAADAPTTSTSSSAPAPTTSASQTTPPAELDTVDEDEVEVLGVQIVATPETDDTQAADEAAVTLAQPATPVATASSTGAGSDWSPLLLAAAIAVGIAAGGTVLRTRAHAAVAPVSSTDKTEDTEVAR